MPQQPDLYDMQERLDELESRWRDTNQRQRDSITRMSLARQRVLDIINDQHYMISDQARSDLRLALDAPVSEELIAAVTEVMNRKKP